MKLTKETNTNQLTNANIRALSTEELQALTPGNFEDYISLDKGNNLWKAGFPAGSYKASQLAQVAPQGSFVNFKTIEECSAKDVKKYTRRMNKYAESVGLTFTGFVASSWDPCFFCGVVA